MSVFVGLDVSLNSISICVVDAAGELVWQGKVASGYNRAGAKISEGVRESFRLQGLMGGVKGQLDCIHESLKSITARTSRTSTSRFSSRMATTIRSCRSRPRR